MAGIDRKMTILAMDTATMASSVAVRKHSSAARPQRASSLPTWICWNARSEQETIRGLRPGAKRRTA